MATLKWLKSGGNYYYFDNAPVHASSITLNESSISLSEAGQTEQLTATISPDDAVEKKPHWSSSDLTVAFVDQTGLVTCINPGNCTITAECDGVSATCSIMKGIAIDFLLVGGGGGGGFMLCASNRAGGGGGAGGVIQCSGYILTSNNYNVNIGAGGTGGYAGGAPCYCAYPCGCSGGDSCFGDIVAYGGGGGDGSGSGTHKGCDGGSGGGGGTTGTILGGCGCEGQGYNGGAGYGDNCGDGGGGGGAGGPGCNGCKGNPTQYSDLGNGGPGICSDISGILDCYAGGGAGGGSGKDGGGSMGCYGKGGNGSKYGAGGGGARCCNAGTGCQGVFILRYLTSCGYDISGGCCYTCGDYTIHCFTSDGTLTVSQ